MHKSVLVAALILTVLPFTADAHSAQSGDIYIGHIWGVVEPDGKTVDVYGPIENKGGAPDMLVSIDVTDAKTIKLASHIDGADLGAQNPGELDIALIPDEPVALSPHGKYIKLTDLDKTFKNGDHIPLTMHFHHAPSVNIDAILEDHASHQD